MSSLDPTPIVDVNGRQTLVYKKPKDVSGGLRITNVALPKSSVVSAIENAEQDIVRAQAQIDQVKRLADSRQQDFDRVREELSLVRFFDPIHLVNLTQTSAHAQGAYIIQDFIERYSSEDVVALRDAANDFCEENIKEILDALEEKRRYGVSWLHGEESMRGRLSVYITLKSITQKKIGSENE